VIPGWTAKIHNVALQGDLARIKLLLAKDPSLANATNQNGRTPLHYAAYEGHKKIVMLLIAKGAKVNAKNDRDRTPLNIASIVGHKEIVDLLIANGGKSYKRKNSLLSPHKGDEAFFSQTSGL